MSALRVVCRRASTTPLALYAERVRTKRLNDDPYQRKIISSLELLHSSLATYEPPRVTAPSVASLKPSLFKRLFARAPAPSEHDIKGIYLWGDVGCGKTMLMDLFYATVPLHLPKTRLHFHQFMQNLHKRLYELKRAHHMDLDVIPLLAAEIAQKATVLCFDEFQVTDVADAMLLRRLMLLLLTPKYGVVLFATLNRAPDDLYLNGIQRVLFIPCIQLIKRQTRVVFLNSPTDYRKVPRPTRLVYHYPKPGVKYHSKLNLAACRNHVEQWFAYFNQGNVTPQHELLSVWGRQLQVPRASKPYVAQFTFEELCGHNLSAGDYLKLAHEYHAFVVTDIPFLSIDARDRVRRFITFLDAVYDAHGCLACTAAAPFNDLFVEPENLSKDNYQLYTRQANMGAEETFENDELVVKHGFDKLVAKKAAMFANDEEKFAFARALSRLTQMSTSDWIETSRETV